MTSTNETDLIVSLLRHQTYLEEITEEMTYDDTLDLLGGSRKAKPGIKNMDHIVGVSDLVSRQKAKEMKLKSVTLGKQKQLLRCVAALGVYLRRFVIDNLSKQNAMAADISLFGKFTLVPTNSDAANGDRDALYSKKLVFDPNSNIA